MFERDDPGSNRWSVPFLIVFFGVLLANVPLGIFMDLEEAREFCVITECWMERL
jgi:hypothetical protein